MSFFRDMVELMSTMVGNVSSNSSSLTGMNSMILHFGNREFILFNFWKTGSVPGLVASVLIIVLMSIFYEAVKALRIHFSRNRAIELQNEIVHSTIIVRQSTEHVDSVSRESLDYSPILRFRGLKAFQQLFTWYRVVQALLYFTQALVAYTLMLTAMTFNVWIILAIVSGEAIGYFIFSGEPVVGHNFDSCC